MNDGAQVPDCAKCCLPAPVWRDTARDLRLPAKIPCKSSHQIVFQSLRHFEYKNNSGQVVKDKTDVATDPAITASEPRQTEYENAPRQPVPKLPTRVDYAFLLCRHGADQ